MLAEHKHHLSLIPGPANTTGLLLALGLAMFLEGVNKQKSDHL